LQIWSAFQQEKTKLMNDYSDSYENENIQLKRVSTSWQRRRHYCNQNWRRSTTNEWCFELTWSPKCRAWSNVGC
jgi:hypothetical protein